MIDIKGIFGFKYRKMLSLALILVSSNFIEVILRLKPLCHIMISLESYHQTYIYDTGNNLTNLSHQYWQALKKICRYHYDQQNYDKILGNFRQFDKSLLLFAC
jgi:hypothetical protein